MTARTPSPLQWTPPFPLAAPQMTEQMFNFYRTGLNTWLALVNATLSGAEHVRMTQLATDVETLAENRRAAEGLAACTDFNGLLGVQTSLARAYAEGCAKYWTSMAELMRGTQAEMAKVMSARAGELNEAWKGAVREAAVPANKERKAA